MSLETVCCYVIYICYSIIHTYITWIVMIGGDEDLQGKVQNLSGITKVAFLSEFLIKFWKFRSEKCESSETHPGREWDRVLTEMGSCLGMALKCKQVQAVNCLPYAAIWDKRVLANEQKTSKFLFEISVFPIFNKIFSIYQSVYFVLISNAKVLTVFFSLKHTYLLVVRGGWNGENTVVVRVFANTESPQCTRYR